MGHPCAGPHGHTYQACRLTCAQMCTHNLPRAMKPHVHVHTGDRLTHVHTRCAHTTPPTSPGNEAGLSRNADQPSLADRKPGTSSSGWPCLDFRRYINYDSHHNGFLVIIIPYDSRFCMIQTLRLCPGARVGSARVRVPGRLTRERLVGYPTLTHFCLELLLLGIVFFPKMFLVFRKRSLLCSASPSIPLHSPFSEK